GAADEQNHAANRSRADPVRKHPDRDTEHEIHEKWRENADRKLQGVEVKRRRKASSHARELKLGEIGHEENESDDREDHPSIRVFSVLMRVHTRGTPCFFLSILDYTPRPQRLPGPREQPSIKSPGAELKDRG